MLRFLISWLISLASLLVRRPVGSRAGALWVVLHHWGGHPPESRAAALAIAKREGYSDIPYNWIVTARGEVWKGRPEGTNAANLGLNANSVSVCLLGNFDEADNPNGAKGLPMFPTDAQMEAAGQLLRDIFKRHPKAKLIQHKDVVRLVPRVLWYNRNKRRNEWVSTATACPGSRFVKSKLAAVLWQMVCGHSLREARLRVE